MFYDPNNPEEVSKALLAKWFWSEELEKEWYSLVVPDCRNELKGEDKLWFEFLSEVRGWHNSIPCTEEQLKRQRDLETVFDIFKNNPTIDEKMVDMLKELDMFNHHEDKYISEFHD